MLLNSFGQPTVLARGNAQLNIDEFLDSPLLLCHNNALLGKLLPKNYIGCIYGSDKILDDIERNKYKINNYSKVILMPNETIEISLNDATTRNLYLDNRIKLTMIPLDEENFVYLIQASNVTSLLTDNLNENLDSFVCNKILRKNIKTGIDVLYINDGVYNKCSQLPIYPTECFLGALATIVQPRFIVGMSGKDLPQYFLDCCRPEDLYNNNC